MAPRLRRTRRVGLAFAIVAALAVLLGFAALTRTASRKLSGLVLGGLGESFSTRVYSAPFSVHEGLRQYPEKIIRRLERLGYRPVAHPPLAEGEYAWEPPALTVHLRGFDLPWDRQAKGVVRLVADEEAGWTVENSRGVRLAKASLEPQRAAELSGPEKIRRELATWDDLPERLKQAVVAVEDKRFYSHWGLDPKAIARAAWRNVRGGSYVQGGSTITQQLAKNFFLTPKRTLRRKLAEAGLALYLESRYSKREILTMYLNHIYLGQDGPVSVAGVQAASRFYFGKPVAALDAAECASLAGIIRSPYRYDPARDLQASRRRRDFVLDRMVEAGFLSGAEAAGAKAKPLSPARRPKLQSSDPYAYFVAETIRRLQPRYGEEALFRHGLTIHTTMDPLLQEAAQQALKKTRHQAALVAFEPASGRVLAVVGGRDFGESQFNRATQARRQPGSAFKPFVYGAALEAGFTPASLLVDEPRVYPKEKKGGVWEPRNYDGVYKGTTTLREAISLSLNGATLELLNRLGPGRAAAFAARMGISSRIHANLGVGLGAYEVTLLELAGAFCPFANGGFRVEPLVVTAVYDAEGRLLESAVACTEPALAPAVSRLMTSLLETAVVSGTARWLPAHGFSAPAAGKTGTTNEGRDGWFVGYTPRLLAGVWVGEDDSRPIGLSGAKDALPIWASFMARADSDGPPEGFPEPESLVRAKVDPASGALARAGCPQSTEELFVEGTEPTEYCPQHPGGLRGWFRRLFGD